MSALSFRVADCPGADTRTAGFSLLEVLCATMILGVGLVGLTEGITLTLKTSKESEVSTIAILLAESHMEEIRVEGYVSEGVDEGDFGADFQAYTWKHEIEADSLDGLYKISVTVFHTGPDEKIVPMYRLETLVFDMPYNADFEDEEDEDPTGLGGGPR